jgi:hypothetical protein
MATNKGEAMHGEEIYSEMAETIIKAVKRGCSKEDITDYLEKSYNLLFRKHRECDSEMIDIMSGTARASCEAWACSRKMPWGKLELIKFIRERYSCNLSQSHEMAKYLIDYWDDEGRLEKNTLGQYRLL